MHPEPRSPEGAPVPRPSLRHVDNRTPFATFQCDKMGPGRRYYDVVVVKGTFELTRGTMRPAAAPAPIRLADTYVDPQAPERSSVEAAGDVVVTKPSTDVIVRGSVRPPGGRPTRKWEVSLAAHRSGDASLLASFDVMGPRRFRHAALLGWRLTDPEPTDAVPVRYELAYGGAHADPDAPERTVRFASNPCGRGHWDPRLLEPSETYPAPQWEVPSDPVRSPLCGAQVAGLGPIARWWTPRIEHAGTYDDAWLERARGDAARGIALDYAADFDARFFQCAHPSLVSARHLEGDETLALHGMLADARTFETRLPALRVIAAVRADDGRFYDHRLPLDTVTIDLDERTVALVWRLTIHQAFGVERAILTTETFS